MELEFEGVRFDRADAADEVGQEVCRYDLAELRAPERTDAGFLRAEGFITRTGVFAYTHADGSRVRELRPPEEVFASESLRSFSFVPLTLEHPPMGEDVTPTNARKFAVGTVGMPERMGEHAKAEMMVMDADAIAAVENGKSQLSCGYKATVIPRSGQWVDAQGMMHQFDAVQTKIRGNHVALTDVGRAGPTARLRVDSADAVLAEQSKGSPAMAMKKVTINGKTYEVDEAIAEAIERRDSAQATNSETEKLGRQLEEERKSREKLEGVVEAMKSEAAKRDTDEAEQKRRDQDSAQIAERVRLCAKSAAILGKSVDEVARMDATEVMQAVIKKELPDVSLEGKSEEYMRGIFETVASKRKDTAAEINAIFTPKAGDTSTKTDGKSLEQVMLEQRKAMTERKNKAWQKAS